MNDLDYARMIEIPVNSYDVTYRKPKRYKWKKPETVKEELITAINDEVMSDGEEIEKEENLYETVKVITVEDERRTKSKRKFSVDVIGAQIAVVVVLAITIMLTNIFWQDSGINNLVRNVFASNSQEVEDRSYAEFAPVSPSRTAEVNVEDGVMVFSGVGSIYPVCDGKIIKVAENAQKYDITIEYSPSFTAIISGVDYAYYELGDSVYKSLPVCYSNGGEVKIYLYDNGMLLKNYAIDNGKIVWQS